MHKGLITILIAIICWGTLPLQAAALSYNEEQYRKHFKQAEQHLLAHRFVEGVLSCRKALKYNPGDSLARAFICLCLYEVAEGLDLRKKETKARKYRLYGLMKKVANEGIKAQPHKGECYFFRGLAVARLATTDGILSSLQTAKSVELDWLRAARATSAYVSPTGERLRASSYVALGAYYRLCPSFFLIQMSFGISGDINKSVRYCEKALALEPNRIEIVKELGVSLITRGLQKNNKKEIERGKAYLRQVAGMKIRLKTDYIDKEHCKMLLRNINLCPEYSRDQQQDISEATYRKMQAMKKNKQGVKK